MKPHEISHVSIHLGAEVGVQDALVWTRVIPAGRDGKKVFARSPSKDEPDPGTKVAVYPYLGETFHIEPGNLKIFLKDVDRIYNRDAEGYAPIADLLFLWMKLGIAADGRRVSEEVFRYLLAAGRRLDMAQQLRADLLRRLNDEHETLFTYRNAIFAALGQAETMCIALGRAVEMVADAPGVASRSIAIPTTLDGVRPALRAIRNAFEHIEDRAKGQVRNKPHPDALSIFDQKELFVSRNISYGSHSIGVNGELRTVLLEARSMLFSLAEACAGDGIQHNGSIGFFDGTTSLLDYERVKERAYFLWKNRTGSRWWDADANWIEAERLGGEVSRRVKEKAG